MGSQRLTQTRGTRVRHRRPAARCVGLLLTRAVCVKQHLEVPVAAAVASKLKAEAAPTTHKSLLHVEHRPFTRHILLAPFSWKSKRDMAQDSSPTLFIFLPGFYADFTSSYPTASNSSYPQLLNTA